VNMQKTLRFSAANKLNYWAMLLLIVLQVFVSIGRVTALPTVVGKCMKTYEYYLLQLLSFKVPYKSIQHETI